MKLFITKHIYRVRLLENGGKFSYSLYLCHPLLFTVIGIFISLNSITYFIYILLAVCLSFIFYKVIEYPSHLLAKKLTQKKLALHCHINILNQI